jgi:ElaB/YqjD/DUF883 family membrane-anchored ribosome-binding protein
VKPAVDAAIADATGKVEEVRPIAEQAFGRVVDKAREVKPALDAALADVVDRVNEVRPAVEQTIERAVGKTTELKPILDRYLSEVAERFDDILPTMEQTFGRAVEKAAEVKPALDKTIADVTDRIGEVRPAMEQTVERAAAALGTVAPALGETVSHVVERVSAIMQPPEDTPAEPAVKAVDEPVEPAESVVRPLPPDTVTKDAAWETASPVTAQRQIGESALPGQSHPMLREQGPEVVAPEPAPPREPAPTQEDPRNTRADTFTPASPVAPVVDRPAEIPAATFEPAVPVPAAEDEPATRIFARRAGEETVVHHEPSGVETEERVSAASAHSDTWEETLTPVLPVDKPSAHHEIAHSVVHRGETVFPDALSARSEERPVTIQPQPVPSSMSAAAEEPQDDVLDIESESAPVTVARLPADEPDSTLAAGTGFVLIKDEDDFAEQPAAAVTQDAVAVDEEDEEETRHEFLFGGTAAAEEEDETVPVELTERAEETVDEPVAAEFVIGTDDEDENGEPVTETVAPAPSALSFGTRREDDFLFGGDESPVTSPETLEAEPVEEPHPALSSSIFDIEKPVRPEKSGHAQLFEEFSEKAEKLFHGEVRSSFGQRRAEHRPEPVRDEVEPLAEEEEPFTEPPAFGARSFKSVLFKQPEQAEPPSPPRGMTSRDEPPETGGADFVGTVRDVDTGPGQPDNGRYDPLATFGKRSRTTLDTRHPLRLARKLSTHHII